MFRTARWGVLVGVGALGLAGAVGAQPEPGSPAPALPESPTPRSADLPPADAAARPERTPLVVGDPAPALKVEAWLKGGPIEKFEPGHVYVVEFWATWCRFCKRATPVMSAIQRRYPKDVTVIGVDIWERLTSEVDKPEGEFLERAKKYVADEGDAMGYAAAYDGAAGAMAKTWVEAAKRYAIPCAFIVGRDGRIEWMTNPLQPEGELEDVLSRVVAGTWDREKGVAELRQRQEVERKGNAMLKRFQQAMDNNRLIEAQTRIDEMTDLDPSRFGRLAGVKFHMLLVQLRDDEKAYAYAKRVEGSALFNDALVVNDIACIILEEPGVKTRDADVAMRFARRAAELSKEEDGLILGTLAEALAAKDDMKAAAETEERALAKLAPGVAEETRENMRAKLEKYRAASAGK